MRWEPINSYTLLYLFLNKAARYTVVAKLLVDSKLVNSISPRARVRVNVKGRIRLRVKSRARATVRARVKIRVKASGNPNPNPRKYAIYSNNLATTVR